MTVRLPSVVGSHDRPRLIVSKGRIRCTNFFFTTYPQSQETAFAVDFRRLR